MKCEMDVADGIGGKDGEDYWMDNEWQSVGVRMLTTQNYIDYVYNYQANDKPWMLFIGKTPYGGPDGDFKSALMLLKRITCMKKAYGDELNVALVDTFKEEFVREAFDPEVHRMGAGAPLVVVVKVGTVYHSS